MLDLNKALGQLSQVRLRGGVVGKVTLAVIVCGAALGGIGVAGHSNPWVAGGAILAIPLLAVPLLWRVIGFAKENPQAAILEGAEFLVHTQLTLASKTQGDIDDALLQPLEDRTPVEYVLEADQPDVDDKTPRRS